MEIVVNDITRRETTDLVLKKDTILHQERSPDYIVIYRTRLKEVFFFICQLGLPVSVAGLIFIMLRAFSDDVVLQIFSFVLGVPAFIVVTYLSLTMEFEDGNR